MSYPFNSTNQIQNVDNPPRDRDRWYDLARDKKLEHERNNNKSKTCGSAGFISEHEAQNSNLFQPGTGANICPYLGSFRSKFDNSDKAIYAQSPSIIRNQGGISFQGSGHNLTVAPTRMGKGSGQIVPNLLTKPGSFLVLDIKGENYKLTAGYRQRNMGQKLVSFAPFESSTSVWNPFAIKFTEPYEIEEYAVALANLLIIPDIGQDRGFWDDAAKEFLVALIVYVLTVELAHKESLHSDDQPVVNERSMRELSRLSTLNAEGFNQLLKDMMIADSYIVRRYASSMEQKFMNEGRTGASVLATINRNLAVWHHERLYRATYQPSADPEDKEPAPNDFEFSELLDGNTCIYLMTPPESLSEYRPVLRVMIGLAIRELIRATQKQLNNGEDNNNPPVLFLLDEFPQLHYMSPIEDGLSYLAGYGINLWFFVQDINQLKIHYPRSWMSFFSNCAAKCFFGVNDLETATLVSEWIGNETVQQISKTESDSIDKTSYNPIPVKNISVTQSPVTRAVMTPDEVMRMPRYEMIIFINGLRPIYAELPKYFESEILVQRTRISPINESQAVLLWYFFLYWHLFQYSLD
ncbi:hypothetical protein A1359_07290 [Methylomonas lenta]|uniref:Conjugal transfer protein TraG n=1 Tax=Methylomonas lenta TaxID=980561 RepID=A0A177NEF9_9GAMM|nr:type IV secretory system conjugative DNA transfer family protein [Methylomonas lenta]OAI16448.1 hypothetical protein A1359_07290 [Methylomonas lenta]